MVSDRQHAVKRVDQHAAGLDVSERPLIQLMLHRLRAAASQIYRVALAAVGAGALADASLDASVNVVEPAGTRPCSR